MSQRLLFTALTVWSAITIAFFLLRLIPGDALSSQMDLGGATPEEIAQARHAMGLDAPPIMQYIGYMGGLLRGDLGYSLVRLIPVSEIIGQRIAPTALLAVLAMVMAAIWGIITGVMSASRGLWGIIGRSMMMLALATPIYWTGTLAIITFAPYIPYTGTDDWRAWILPITLLAFHGMGGIARVLYANIKMVQSQIFITVAHSKGLPRTIIIRRHLLRVALLPVLPVISTQFGLLLGGVVITESLFVRAGLGNLLFDAVIAQDYPIVQGVILLSALVYGVLSIITDMIHYVADPRLRWKDES
jgi:peptide/nickel transport system permease protein